MLERLRPLLMRLLRVPPEPSLPIGARDVLVFRAAPNYYRYRLLLWIIPQVGALIGLIVGFIFLSRVMSEVSHPLAIAAFRIGEAVGWGAFILQLPFSFALLRLDFELRWYIVSDRSLRIREGIISLREKTMTYANIQQISIRQNPLQRLLHLADVQVSTAGGGSSGSESGHSHGEGMHEAWFRGVDNAEVIRSAIRDRVRLHRDAGLGDPDEPEMLHAGAGGFTAIAAARELHQEVRELRQAVVGLASE